MNGRQFKKLCKRAAEVMIKIEPKIKSTLVISEERGEPPEITRHYKWDMDTLRQNWRWKTRKEPVPDVLPSGIAGFGGWDGYYEPEWYDEDALSFLMNYVIAEFYNWEGSEIGGFINNECPQHLTRFPNKAIKYLERKLLKKAA
ncbi:hypothetical protein OEK23_003579 [Vibrio cholerae]|nr:hypothetical protein [Vibrio cholerae]